MKKNYIEEYYHYYLFLLIEFDDLMNESKYKKRIDYINRNNDIYARLL
jgi:hypothetical protein